MPVADVVMGPPLHLAGAHREQRPSAIQSLGLRLLVDSENRRLLRGMEVETRQAGYFGLQPWSLLHLKPRI